MSRNLSGLFEEYAAYHRHPANQLCHYVGIPLIVFTLVGLLLRLGPVPAVLIALAVLAYDLTLSVKLTLPFAAFLVFSFLASPSIPAGVLWAGFALGWVLQLVGHFAFEKRSPAFLTNLKQLLVGPLWILETLGGTPSADPEAPRSAPSGE